MVRGLREHDGPLTQKGYDLHEVISALQKEIRRGKEREAVYWARELESFDPKILWNRLRVMASEDVGLADPLASLLVDVMEKNYSDAIRRKNDSSMLFLVYAVLYLARCRKSRIVDNLLAVVYNDDRRLEIPDYTLDMHTVKGKRNGRGLEHFFGEGAKLKNKALEDPYEKAAFEALKRKRNR